MISILCDKHEEEYRSNHLALPPKQPDEDWFSWSAKAKRVDNSDCSDCITLGLSNQGKTEELDSPNDWMFT